jgi:ABC-type bacteriocin/lantibiotic exporter with double-glycine peptidase domain
MSFEEYLDSKKIDLVQFSKEEPKLFQEWKQTFEQVHPNSFTAQKLYLINSIRRKFPKTIITPS